MNKKLKSVESKNKNCPLLTVAIPTFNNPKGLETTLRCITQQTYKNLKIIISDNCSPGKETEKVVRKFMAHDKRISYFRQKRNIGAWMNYDSALRKAKTDYFMWACDDDEWLSDFIEKCMNKLLKNPSFDMVLTECRIISEKDKGFFGEYHIKTNFNFFLYLKKLDALSLFILMDDTTHKANLLLGIWKTDVAKEVMDSIPHLYSMHHSWKGLDISVLIYALARIKFYQIPEKLYIKKYGAAAPGSLINRAKGIKAKFVNLFKPRTFFRYYKEVYNVNMTHFDMLKEALRMSGVPLKKLRKSLAIKKTLYFFPLELRAIVSSFLVSILYPIYKIKSFY